jgi:hypothetical protein
MKLATERSYANPEAAARNLVELASGIEPVQAGRIYVEVINYPMLFKLRPRLPSTRQASISPSNVDGSSCTRARPMCGS